MRKSEFAVVAIPEKFTGWRLDIFDPWEMFCACVFHSRQSKNADPKFFRRLSKRSCIFCGIASIEANCNHVILTTKHAKSLGWDAALLRKKSIWDKVRALHDLSPDIDLFDYFTSQVSQYVEVRNETAHPKRRDHAIQDFIDEFDLASFMQAIQLCIVRIYDCVQEEYPYWIHGWNYLNPISETEITLINNTQFLFSLSALNFKFDIGVQPGMPQATKRYLRSERQFFAIEQFLAGDGALVEYVDPEIPTKPLLVRDWHDLQAIEGILAQLPDWVRKLRTD